jgi:8-oxo-dGTP pyrophosphatase MutT (NUDIX family)
MKKWAGALLITTSGEVILQKRDVRPNITNSGKTSLFGGTVEESESIEDCLKREIEEEVGINVDNFSFFGLYKKRQATHGEDYDCYVYLVNDIDVGKINVREGLGYKLVSADDNYLTAEYTLITQAILGDYFKKIN